MIYPKLVRPSMCKTPIVVYAGEETLDEDSGQHVFRYQLETKCNYQTGGTVRAEGSSESFIKISGRCLFSGDIFPDLYEIPCGKVEIFGTEREINRGYKHRNPDGTVNFVELEIK